MTGTRREASTITLSGLYAYIFCMMASSAVTGLPILGGALYMCGQVTMAFGSAFSQRNLLPQRAQRWRGGLLVAMLAANLCLMVIYPIAQDIPRMWVMFVTVASMLLRERICMSILRRQGKCRIGTGAGYRMTALCHGLMLLMMASVLMYNLPKGTALRLLGGYGLCGVLTAYDMYKAQKGFQGPLEGQRDHPAENVRRANAVVTFELMSMLINIAQEMTLVVLYTYLAVTAQTMLISMVLAVAATLIFREGADWLVHRHERRQIGDPTNIMLLGLLMWLWGLWSFSQALQGGELVRNYTYLCLGLCSAGSTLCDTCLQRMDRAVTDAVAFARGSEDEYRHARAASQELALLLGQMLALCTLTVLCFVTGKDLPRDMAQLAARFRPVMVLPALLMVVMAILSVLRFPLSSRYMHKLRRFLTIRSGGGDNPSLEKQLEAVVVQRHRQPFGTRMIMAVLRPFFRHTLKGAENIVQDENNPIVFLCNHGEIYGPVSGMLFIPVHVRPWVISELTSDPLEVSQYIYKWTLSPIKWLGPARWWISRLLGPVAVWAMRQFEAIPVYRNKPRELMTTFRRSVEAMEAGDNLLIFPENPDASEKPGYAHGHMGELFRGFPMLAQVYYNRTGKCCRFLPMYAHRGNRTLSFGVPVLFDPERDSISERDRIVNEASVQMEELYQREEALYRKKHQKKE